MTAPSRDRQCRAIAALRRGRYDQTEARENDDGTVTIWVNEGLVHVREITVWRNGYYTSDAA